jgi:lysosomal acid lipase/cholesteryl ester hydrolase
VWLGNQRGTKYSLGHNSYDYKTSKDYWLFSYTEMGKYDAPAQVDYIRSISGAAKVAFIGHSQGTTQMFYALSADPTFWKSRVSIFIAFAPVTRLDNTRSKLLKDVAFSYQAFKTAFDIAKVYDLLGPFASEGTKIACGVLPDFC